MLRTRTIDNKEQSRRDDTLLTGGFNRRTDSVAHSTKVAQRRHNVNEQLIMNNEQSLLIIHYSLFIASSTVPAGLWRVCIAFPVRRLKSTVNKVSSLRDWKS